MLILVGLKPQIWKAQALFGPDSKARLNSKPEAPKFLDPFQLKIFTELQSTTFFCSKESPGKGLDWTTKEKQLKILSLSYLSSAYFFNGEPFLFFSWAKANEVAQLCEWKRTQKLFGCPNYLTNTQPINLPDMGGKLHSVMDSMLTSHSEFPIIFT